MRMASAVDILEERVGAATELIANLRIKVQSLERELTASLARALPQPSQPLPPSPDPALVEELERLRAERAVVRESIRGLLREIDRVSW
jgi:FtsZ-binding cell division protein ZapB